MNRLQERVIKKAWVEWIVNAKEWRTFLTLTYRNEVSRETALRDWRFLVRCLNRDLLGKHYTQKVGHSYFSYVVALEYQQRGVLHFHGLVDKPLNFEKVHRVWNRINGFVWISQIKSRIGTVEYICKYLTKGGDLIPFYSNKNFDVKKFVDEIPAWYF